MLQEARPGDPYFSKIGSISSWRTEIVQKLMNKNQLYQSQPHSTLKSNLNKKKLGSQRRLPQRNRVYTIRFKNHHNLKSYNFGLNKNGLSNRICAFIQSTAILMWYVGIRGVKKRDQKEENIVNYSQLLGLNHLHFVIDHCRKNAFLKLKEMKLVKNTPPFPNALSRVLRSVKR